MLYITGYEDCTGFYDKIGVFVENSATNSYNFHNAKIRLSDGRVIVDLDNLRRRDKIGDKVYGVGFDNMYGHAYIAIYDPFLLKIALNLTRPTKCNQYIEGVPRTEESVYVCSVKNGVACVFDGHDGSSYAYNLPYFLYKVKSCCILSLGIGDFKTLFKDDCFYFVDSEGRFFRMRFKDKSMCSSMKLLATKLAMMKL